jgi:hypothetical protein
MDQETLKNSNTPRNPVDKAFYDALAEYPPTPSSGSWKSLSSRLLYRELLRLNFRNLPLTYALIGSGSLAIIAVVLFLIFYNNDGITPQSTVAIEKSAPAPLTGAEKTVEAEKPVPAVPALKTIPGTSPASHKEEILVEKTKPSEEKPLKASEPAIVSPAPAVYESIVVMNGLECYEVKYTGQQDQKRKVRMDKIKNDFVSSVSDPVPLNNKTSNFANPLDKTMNKHYQYFSTGISFNPEITTYNDYNNYSKTNYWFRLNAAYTLLRFSIRSGIGFGIVNDNGKYGAHYIMVSSPPKAPMVLDTVFYSQILETRDRYYYIEIPLMFGYEFLRRPRFHFTLNLGPGVDFLIGSKRSNPDTGVEGAYLIQLNDSTPGRQTTNWFAAAGITMEYRISNSVNIYFEPTFKYFLTNVFKENYQDRKNLYTIGLDIGVNLNFGRQRIKP